MIKPKFEDFDYGEGPKDLSWCQYAKALEEYVTFLEAQDPALRQPPVVGRSECCAPVLHLTLKKYWFDMIKSGVKKEEYREIKGYWVKRFKDMSLTPPFKPFKEFSVIEFKNGYAKDAPTMRVEFKGIRVGKPKVEWCIDAIEFDQDNGSYDDCFIIDLGSVLS